MLIPRSSIFSLLKVLSYWYYAERSQFALLFESPNPFMKVVELYQLITGHESSNRHQMRTSKTIRIKQQLEGWISLEEPLQ